MQQISPDPESSECVRAFAPPLNLLNQKFCFPVDVIESCEGTQTFYMQYQQAILLLFSLPAVDL
jgi:hypothetical protein